MTDHEPTHRRGRHINARQVDPQRTADLSWTREHDTLVWCGYCRNYRSEKHTIHHAQLVSDTGGKPIKRHGR